MGFDTRLDDPTPPTLTSLKLLDEAGIPAGLLQNGEAGTLLFSAADNDGRIFHPIDTAATRLSYRAHRTEAWTALPLSLVLVDDEDATTSGHVPIGHLYRATLDALAALEDTAIDLQIEIADLGGNTATWLMEPAFALGTPEVPVAVVEETPVPARFQIYPNYPNPFNTSTTIRFDVPRPAEVRLVVYDLLGRVVATLIDGPMTPGTQRLTWTGRTNAGERAASGLYFYRLEADDFSEARTMLLVR